MLFYHRDISERYVIGIEPSVIDLDFLEEVKTASKVTLNYKEDRLWRMLMICNSTRNRSRDSHSDEYSVVCIKDSVSYYRYVFEPLRIMSGTKNSIKGRCLSLEINVEPTEKNRCQMIFGLLFVRVYKFSLNGVRGVSPLWDFFSSKLFCYFLLIWLHKLIPNQHLPLKIICYFPLKYTFHFLQHIH